MKKKYLLNQLLETNRNLLKLTDRVVALEAKNDTAETVAEATDNALPDREPSYRGIEWQGFAEKVHQHIEAYAVPQYGDAPDDQVFDWTAEQCVKQVGKYAARFGTNARDGQDELDLLKMAHYACMALTKLKAKG